MTDLQVWVIGTSLLLVGVPLVAVSLTGLVLLWRDERRQRRAVETRRLRDRQLQRNTEQAIRRIQRRYQAATAVALRQIVMRDFQPAEEKETPQ